MRGFEQARREAQLREEHRQRQLVAQQQRGAAAEAGRIQAAVDAAVAREQTIQLPPPADEEPIRLLCTGAQLGSASIALYEKNGRADFTRNGVTKARPASFSADYVTWVGPTARYSLSRLDGTLLSIGGVIPESQGMQDQATCTVAQRKF